MRLKTSLAAVALACALSGRVRGEVAPALTFSAGAGVEAVRRSTVKGTLSDTYPALQAHAEMGATFIAGGALLAVGDLSFPAADRPFTTQLTAGGGLRFGTDLRVTLAGGATFWDVSGTGQVGPSVLAHLAAPLAGGFGIHLQGSAGYFSGVASLAFTVGVGYCE